MSDKLRFTGSVQFFQLSPKYNANPTNAAPNDSQRNVPHFTQNSTKEQSPAVVDKRDRSKRTLSQDSE